MGTMAKHEDRTAERKDSNNPFNRNKNLCVLAVAQYLKVNSKSVKYLHYVEDLVIAARAKYSVWQHSHRLPKKTSVGKARKILKKQSKDFKRKIIGYIVRTDCHVLFLNPQGKTVIDTDPKLRDRRIITHIFAVFDLTPK